MKVLIVWALIAYQPAPLNERDGLSFGSNPIGWFTTKEACGRERLNLLLGKNPMRKVDTTNVTLTCDKEYWPR